MNIKTITCHDVYNAGASLQAYALQKYLQNRGNHVEIIDYKPDYLSRHYSLSAVNNPRYDIPVVKQLYLLAKLFGRLKARKSQRKKAFDEFRDKYLTLTARYDSYEALNNDPPGADVYIAGSDQIWNPLFPNGKDPAFFLQFVKSGKKISYAASIAANHLEKADSSRMQAWLESFDHISVREESAAQLIKEMQLQAQRVCDPVFLLRREKWTALTECIETEKEPYVFICDFDGGNLTSEIAERIRHERSIKVISWFNIPVADKVVQGGPLEFINLIKNAVLIISNSFHATAFAIIFGVDMLTTTRREKINSRIMELLDRFGLGDRSIRNAADIDNVKPISWDKVDNIINNEVVIAEEFFNKTIDKQ